MLDPNFWTRRHRDEVRRVAASVGAVTTLHQLDCPESVAWTRVLARNAALGGSLATTRPTFDTLRGRVEPLGDDAPAHVAHGHP